MDCLFEKLLKFILWGYILLIVMIGWVFFCIENFVDVWNYVLCMWDFDVFFNRSFLIYFDNEKMFILVLVVVFSIVLLRKWSEKIGSYYLVLCIVIEIVWMLVYLLFFFYSIMVLMVIIYNLFIYFNF